MRPVAAAAVHSGVRQSVGAQNTTEARSVDCVAFTAAKEKEVATWTGTVQAEPICHGGRGGEHEGAPPDTKGCWTIHDK